MKSALAAAMLLLAAAPARAQIDPTRRLQLEAGFEEGLFQPGPSAPYAYLFMNHPDVFGSSTNLRMAIAPVYVDAEVGLKNAVDSSADAAFGFSGGGYAFGQTEVRRGDEKRGESFTGHGGGPSASLYPHLGAIGPVPVNGVARVSASYADYRRDYATAPQFALPRNEWTAAARLGLRVGGVPPGLDRAPGGEISGWWESRDREHRSVYGYDGDRVAERSTNLYWTRILLNWEFENNRRLGASFGFGGGSGVDRFSAYRLGGMLTLNSEFPLSIPGYFAQEIEARAYSHLYLRYGLPFEATKRFIFNVFAAGASITPVPGTDAGGAQHAGVGTSVEFAPRWAALRGVLSYGYAPTAARGNGRGGHGVALCLELNFAAKTLPSPAGRPEELQGGLRWLLGGGNPIIP